MRFVVDEASWRFHGLAPAVCVEALETMLDQLDDAHAQGYLAFYSEDLFSTSVWQDKSFYDLYALDSPIPIPRDVRERIGSIFSGLSKWQDLESTWPTSFEIQIGNAAREDAPSVAWAHQQNVQTPDVATACVIFPNGRSAGPFDVTVDTKAITLWFVADGQNYRDFFRWLITEKTKNPAGMERLATSAFPAVDFAEGVFNGIKDMSKPYQELVAPLVRHLATLSDHGKRIFLGPWDRVAAEFGALGIDISDENGNTKGDREARRERTIVIDGEDTVFWWHCKLERHQDRIHINPDRIRNGGRLSVGIFCRHLKT